MLQFPGAVGVGSVVEVGTACRHGYQGMSLLIVLDSIDCDSNNFSFEGTV